jgi:hypothetical protein
MAYCEKNNKRTSEVRVKPTFTFIGKMMSDEEEEVFQARSHVALEVFSPRKVEKCGKILIKRKHSIITHTQNDSRY